MYSLDVRLESLVRGQQSRKMSVRPATPLYLPSVRFVFSLAILFDYFYIICAFAIAQIASNNTFSTFSGKLHYAVLTQYIVRWHSQPTTHDLMFAHHLLLLRLIFIAGQIDIYHWFTPIHFMGFYFTFTIWIPIV